MIRIAMRQLPKLLLSKTFLCVHQRCYSIVPQSNTEKQPTVKDFVKSNVGLSNFLQRVYVTAGAGLATSLVIPATTIYCASQFVQAAAPALLFGGFGTAIIGCFGMAYGKWTVNEARTESTNSLPRQLSFCALVGGMSMALTPFAQAIHEISPTIWPTALALTIGTSGAATLWAHNRPVDSLLSWQGPLYGGLLALVGTGFSGLIAQTFFPASGVGQLLHSVDVYGGILLFTAMTAYETQKAVAMYLDGEPDHLGCAVHVYLDFINLLIRIAEALAKAKGDKDD